MRQTLAQTDAQLSLITSRWPRAHPPNLIAEAADAGENLAPERHIAADQVTYRRCFRRHAQIGAANYPIELWWEPARASVLPQRLNCAAHAQDIRDGIAGQQLLQPIRRCDRIIIQ